MIVRDLIAALQALPPESEVAMLWDGDIRSDVDAAWLTQGGQVAVGPSWEQIYRDSARCAGAVSASENRYLEVGEMMGLKTPATLTDKDLLAAFQRTDGESAEAEALLAEIFKRGLDV